MTRFSPGRFQGLISLILSMLCGLLLVACSGGSSSGGGNTNAGRTGANVVDVSVDGTAFGTVNEPFVSITICSTNNSNSCLNIDHILVDTGSVGLRIFAQPTTTAALSTLNLAPLTSNGDPIGECLQFVQGNTWGPIVSADIQIGEKTASNVAIQVIGDSNFMPAPTICTDTGKLMSTPHSFNANGVLGIGLNLQDCGPVCVSATNAANIYFSCPATGCVNIGMPLNVQVQNPVSLFSSDNNGVILSMAAVSSTGASNATGTLTFGVDTQANNTSGNTTTLQVDSTSRFTTTFEGQNYTDSYFDSGSNALFFNPPSNNLALCSGTESGFYCPPALVDLSAQLSGSAPGTSSATVNFSVANTQSLLSNGAIAFDNLAGRAINGTTPGNTFDWGLPFFYGKDVYVVFEGSTTAKGTGPYFGF